MRAGGWRFQEDELSARFPHELCCANDNVNCYRFGNLRRTVEAAILGCQSARHPAAHNPPAFARASPMRPPFPLTHRLLWCLRLEQSRRIGLEPPADELCERGIALGRGQGQGLLEMEDGFSRVPLSGQRVP